MKDLIARTRTLFDQGLPLAKQVKGKLSVDLEMFSRGGIAVLDAIEAQGYDTLNRRPSISKTKQALLLATVLWKQLFSRKPEVSTAGPEAARHAVSSSASRPATIDETNVAASYEACHQIARAARSNFYYAFYLLPKAKRDGLAALYAFMRLVDNVADDGDDLAAKQRSLAKWRAALDEAVGGFGAFLDGSSALSLQSPPQGAAEVLPALADTSRRFNMPARYLHDQISGAEMDLTIKSYSTFDRLREYCYRVAGTVGLTCTHIFGFKDSRALDLAEKLGLAFQLTNIIRDVREDAERGRIYLPDEDLARFNVSSHDFCKNAATLGVRELLRFEADRAFQLYDEGSELLDLIEADSRGTLWLLIHTYSVLLARIESLDFAVFGERVRLSKAEKMLFIARARFGRHTRDNVLEKRDRDWRRAGRTGGRRRAG
jgi:phytoene synthase